MALQLLLEIKGASDCQVMYYGNSEWVLSIESFKSTYTVTTLEPQPLRRLIIFHLWPTTELKHKVNCI